VRTRVVEESGEHTKFNREGEFGNPGKVSSDGSGIDFNQSVIYHVDRFATLPILRKGLLQSDDGGRQLGPLLGHYQEVQSVSNLNAKEKKSKLLHSLVSLSIL